MGLIKEELELLLKAVANERKLVVICIGANRPDVANRLVFASVDWQRERIIEQLKARQKKLLEELERFEQEPKHQLSFATQRGIESRLELLTEIIDDLKLGK